MNRGKGLLEKEDVKEGSLKWTQTFCTVESSGPREMLLIAKLRERMK